MRKKDKNIAGILALFFGWLGLHRYYLGQKQWGFSYSLAAGIVFWTGRLPILGFVLKFLWLPFMLVVSLVDAITFFTMDERRFDEKYNTVPGRASVEPDFERRTGQRTRHRSERHYQEPRVRKRTAPRQNPYKKSGLEKFRDYDYEGAIEDFKKSLEIAPNDVASHFNLACAYSLTENAEQSFNHLNQAVTLGFSDFQKIREHYALAFLRIQPEFEAFSANGFRLTNPGPAAEDLLQTQPDLLDQLNKLVELRKRGLLTEMEFEKEKKKLMQH